ncbi:MAG TPA: DNA sulfur modification protein DndD, partial [Planctomycetaceae bacterium]|nr:DNA sulfur modification protein DndD [Planctomycetaceae bacterium]
MILDRLTLENFCLYRGRQVLDLRPGQHNGRSAPIVLVGGINGGGKTTLLDAIRLALYGPRAACSKRAGKAYDEFLKASIHRGADAGEGASVAIRFRYASEGQEHVYELRRTWWVRKNRVREKLYVSKNGQPDRWLSDHWNEVVEELIPLGISQLFFFDAEQIRFMAEDARANGKLGAAVKSLLGLDLAERVIADSSVLEARLAKRTQPTADERDLQELDDALAAKEAAVRRKKAERAALENRRLRAEEALRKAEEEFARLDGRHWQQRQARQRRLAEPQNQEAELQSQFVDLVASELPLALVAELLNDVMQQHALEQQAAEPAIVQRLLEQRDRQMLQALRDEGVPDE